MSGLVISRSAHAAMLDAARAAMPMEACGLLLGEGDRIEHATSACNVDPEPARRFEIDPVALFAGLRDARGGGPQVLGYWHSHPSGDATPSGVDAGMAEPDGKYWLIVAGDEVTAWRAVLVGAVEGRFDPVTLSIGPQTLAP